MVAFFPKPVYTEHASIIYLADVKMIFYFRTGETHGLRKLRRISPTSFLLEELEKLVDWCSPV